MKLLLVLWKGIGQEEVNASVSQIRVGCLFYPRELALVTVSEGLRA
jgi:hypothetical protein